MSDRQRHIVFGVTGASGGPYARRLLQGLVAAGVQVHWMVSRHGRSLLQSECGAADAPALLGADSPLIHAYAVEDMHAPPASGSFLHDGMVICPCSSNTLGAVASGLADNLLRRAAMVCLKEGRPLVLVHREMPLSAIDLENLLKLRRAGATICPASPGFYHQPAGVADLVDFVVARVLDQLGVEHDISRRWGQ